MPNIKSAKKKARQDKKRTVRNQSYIASIKNAIKSLIKADKKDEKGLKKTYALIDKAAKRKIIHKNKASRLKSRVSKLGKK